LWTSSGALFLFGLISARIQAARIESLSQF